MPELKYVGPDPLTLTGALPLPEGWPAADHIEENDALAAEKVASGNYTKASAKPPRNAESVSEE